MLIYVTFGFSLLTTFSATADFDATPMSVSLSASQRRGCIQIGIVYDNIADPNEVFEVVLTSNTANVEVASGGDTAVVVIFGK